MVETGLNNTEIGKIILAACFVNDLGTVLALGILFANYNIWLALFAVVTALTMWLLPYFVPWFFAKVGNRVSEPETKFIFLVLFLLGGLASISKSEAVLPAVPGRNGSRPFLSQRKGLGYPDACNGLHILDALLLFESGFAHKI